MKTWDIWSNNPDRTISYQQLKKLIQFFPFIRGIGGHHIRYSNNRNGESEKKYITFVREPIERYLSHWRHQRYKMNIDWSIEQFLDEPRFNNNMTRKFSKSENIDNAIKVIDNLDFVGVQEDFDASLILMKSKLKLGGKFCLNYKYKNKGIRKNITDPFNDKTLDRIKRNNEKDIVLYNYILNNIHKRNKAVYKGDLQSEMQDLKMKKINYKENQVKKIIQILSKNILIRPYDYYLNKIQFSKVK